MLELCPCSKQVYGKDIEADRNARAVRSGEMPQVGCGLVAKLIALVAVDGEFRRCEVTGGTRLDLEDDELIPVPGHQVKIAAQPVRAPAARYDRVAEIAQVEERGVLAALADQQMGCFGGLKFAVGAGAEASISTMLQTRKPRVC